MITFGVFTFGDALLTVLELALLFMWIWVAVGVVLDIFRSHDLSGLAKAAWVLLIVIFPLIGVLLYLLFRGQGMHDRSLRAASAQQQAVNQYIRTAARTPAEDLANLDDLRNRGVLTDEEFERAKAKVLD
ncbi:MAG TPA: SHOCT domain-containing protein [Solirubrobacteraceae bacterium]|jgi:putative Ca2+/H+ antiporter (TMEM165/GDT1 family)|nr:SHOCT domain-containing protein [Solirubrobacteraceae bacterium]